MQRMKIGAMRRVMRKTMVEARAMDAMSRECIQVLSVMMCHLIEFGSNKSYLIR